jgi:crotonobetainyl-CoA:carnitine CoA-transferase CaiB-like acyl-CoA transferase
LLVVAGMAVVALLERLAPFEPDWNRDHDGEGREGCTVDVALSESVLSLMEGLLPEYGKLGKIKQPTGGGIATAAPSNAYPTRDKSWVLIGANSDPLFVKLASLMERYDLLQSPDYADNVSRVRNAKVLDAEIAKWTFQYDAEDLLDKLSAADIPSSKAYTAADCAADEQYRYRKMVREVFDPAFGENILHAGVVPHIPEMPGTVRWAGVEVGRHTSDILTGLLGKSPEDISTLREEGVVG